MYGDVVLGVQKREGEDHEPFEVVIEEFKHEKYHKDISTAISPPKTSRSW
jgi:pyruvate,orthophosphate dikinase